jgi:amino acid transporter
VLAAVCVVLTVEAAAPSAALGTSQYFWWIVLFVAFFLPYGLINAELGTSYAGGGDLFDWVNRAFGRTWGSRVAWYYWLEYALWFASLAELGITVINQVLGAFSPGFSVPGPVGIVLQLAMIWLITYFGNHTVAENRILINIATVCKVAIMLLLGILGVAALVLHGGTSANPISSPADLLPGPGGISAVAVIIFNFMGFEVVTTFADDMDNPKKQIPQALFLGGILVAAFYLFACFGIGVAVPAAQIDPSAGLLDSFGYFFSLLPAGVGPILLLVVGAMFVYTLIANLLVWGLGVHYVAMYAADSQALPPIFGGRKAGTTAVPQGASIVSGIVASILVVIAPAISALGYDMFWAYFDLQVFMLLCCYFLLFPTFLRLRLKDGEHERAFRVPGGQVGAILVTVVPMVALTLGLLFCIWYPSGDGPNGYLDLTLLIGGLLCLIAGEVVVRISAHQRKHNPQWKKSHKRRNKWEFLKSDTNVPDLFSHSA